MCVCVCVCVRVCVCESGSFQKNAFFFFLNFILLAILVIVHAGKSMNPQHHCEAVLTLCRKKMLLCILKEQCNAQMS